jgi:CTP synthase
MQLMAIEVARHQGNTEATSLEFIDTTNTSSITNTINPSVAVVVPRESQKMRLGNKIVTFAHGVDPSNYGYPSQTTIFEERHRHRYQVVPFDGLNIVAWDKTGTIPEIIDIGTKEDSNRLEHHEPHNEWWSVGCQFHPEYSSRNFRPHPLFVKLIEKSMC